MDSNATASPAGRSNFQPPVNKTPSPNATPLGSQNHMRSTSDGGNGNTQTRKEDKSEYDGEEEVDEILEEEEEEEGDDDGDDDRDEDKDGGKEEEVQKKPEQKISNLTPDFYRGKSREVKNAMSDIAVERETENTIVRKGSDGKPVIQLKSESAIGKNNYDKIRWSIGQQNYVRPRGKKPQNEDGNLSQYNSAVRETMALFSNGEVCPIVLVKDCVVANRKNLGESNSMDYGTSYITAGIPKVHVDYMIHSAKTAEIPTAPKASHRVHDGCYWMYEDLSKLSPEKVGMVIGGRYTRVGLREVLEKMAAGDGKNGKNLLCDMVLKPTMSYSRHKNENDFDPVNGTYCPSFKVQEILIKNSTKISEPPFTPGSSAGYGMQVKKDDSASEELVRQLFGDLGLS